MSLFVTGELTRNLANKKLNISDVDPIGATYSVATNETVQLHL